jgi:hypothetical protein
MLVTSANLKSLLQNNVCEVKFLRKRPKLGASPYRRMVCTNANQLLLSPDGRLTLNFSPAKGAPRFNQMEKNVVVAWDVLMQDYRAVNCESCDLIASVPANEQFWNYFREELLPMTAGQKTAFMNS